MQELINLNDVNFFHLIGVRLREILVPLERNDMFIQFINELNNHLVAPVAAMDFQRIIAEGFVQFFGSLSFSNFIAGSIDSLILAIDPYDSGFSEELSRFKYDMFIYNKELLYISGKHIQEVLRLTMEYGTRSDMLSAYDLLKLKNYSNIITDSMSMMQYKNNDLIDFIRDSLDYIQTHMSSLRVGNMPNIEAVELDYMVLVNALIEHLDAQLCAQLAFGAIINHVGLIGSTVHGFIISKYNVTY